MGDDQISTVKDVVADEIVEKRGHLFAELLRFIFELGEGLGEPLSDAYVLAAQLAGQLHVVVAGDAQRIS